ncbi:hypothetical protein [Austwickia sp. TVS 96-490-7B]|uniref:hypothetical protein n=1 Tax=Austwickia sp. TVS 96-490-7B TaxID=2830843 RepID=UPI001C575D23|nr:hypothetical protein [Austwickia sp. TVS 96-490-7B]
MSDLWEVLGQGASWGEVVFCLGVVAGLAAVTVAARGRCRLGPLPMSAMLPLACLSLVPYLGWVVAGAVLVMWRPRRRHLTGAAG